MALKRLVFLIIGCICLGLGTVGIFLPILPTVPFYMATVFCFSQSSQKLHDWFIGTELYKKHLKSLLEHISGAIEKAYANKNNTLKSHSDYYIDYLNLRKEQCEILLHVYYIVAHHDFVVEEAAIVAEIIREVADHLHVQREIGMIKVHIDKVTDGIIHGEMPTNHQEFEGKAVLYQLLNELREFLWHQEVFLENVTEEQILAYWE